VIASAGVDILIATPGPPARPRGENRRPVRELDVFVLDEADRMLDMGFIHDVRRVIAMLPPKRQTLFFSATMPPEAQRAGRSAADRPAQVAVTPVSSTVERIEQSRVLRRQGREAHAARDHPARRQGDARVLVFTAHQARRQPGRRAPRQGGIGAAAIHGNKSQGAARARAGRFKAGKIRVLVATDIAARGIDIDEMTHVINFDLPEVPETYVHRIGRTARAGADGRRRRWRVPRRRRRPGLASPAATGRSR
jgi:ATP-dependent RNA helicase RhlE